MDCREGLKQLDDKSIDCCISSPPYWSLRDYGIEASIWDGDPKCEHEFGKWKNEKNIRKYKIYDKEWERPSRKEFNKVSSKTKCVVCKKEFDGKIGQKFCSIKCLNTLSNEDRTNLIPEKQFCLKCGAWKGTLGLEPNFKLYIKHLCDIYDQVKRVLKPTGTCWVNLGDTYGGSSLGKSYAKHKKGPNSILPDNTMYSMPKVGHSRGKYDKCLLMIPQRFAIEMINRGWILRNIIIWQKPNAMPSSAKDRFTVNFENVYFFVKKKKYWFEQQREPHESEPHRLYAKKWKSINSISRSESDGSEFYNPLGRNMRTVWKIPTKANPEAHFATFPSALVKPMIKSGCPEFICTKCGKPREQIIESSIINNSTKNFDNIKYSKANLKLSKTSTILTKKVLPKEIKGYSDCGCNTGFERGIVLDPFAGIGTTLKQAWKLGRNYIGFEISEEYCKIANKNLSLTKNIRLDNFIYEKQIEV